MHAMEWVGLHDLQEHAACWTSDSLTESVLFSNYCSNNCTEDIIIQSLFLTSIYIPIPLLLTMSLLICHCLKS